MNPATLTTIIAGLALLSGLVLTVIFILEARSNKAADLMMEKMNPGAQPIKNSYKWFIVAGGWIIAVLTFTAYEVSKKPTPPSKHIGTVVVDPVPTPITPPVPPPTESTAPVKPSRVTYKEYVETHPAPRPTAATQFDPHHSKPGDARIVNPDEIRWLQNQLTEARQKGQGLPENKQPLVLPELAQSVRSKIQYVVVTGSGWPESEEQVWAQGYGKCADQAYLVALNLLHNGFRNVGVRLGVPPDYQPPTPGHAWVVVLLDGKEWIIDTTSTNRVLSAKTSALQNYLVTATVFPKETQAQ